MPTTTASTPPTRTAQQLAMLDDDGNPNHPDEPDVAIAASARLVALIRARPLTSVAISVTLGLVVGAVTGRAA